MIASTPAITQELPAHTPPIWPFLFITIACGAVSGFHCLVSSGTSSKQLSCETDALSIGYGSMLLEAALAVVVILACCAGVGMGKFKPVNVVQANGVERIEYQAVVNPVTKQPMTQREAWRSTYELGEGKSWETFTLSSKIGAFVEGGANFLTAVGIPLQLGIGIIAVLVACFAATTLDSATRLQRYVIQELGRRIANCSPDEHVCRNDRGRRAGRPDRDAQRPGGYGIGRAFAVAVVWSDQPVVGRTGIHGHDILPVASK